MQRPRSNFYGLAAGAAMAAAITLLPAVGAAQPAPDQPPQGRSQEGKPPLDREALKARLQRRLEESRKSQERLEAAIKRLDEGASPDDVRTEMEGDIRGGRGGGPQAMRGNGGGPGRPDGEGRGGRFGDRGRGPGEGPPPAPVPDRELVLEFLKNHPGPMATRLSEAIKNNPREADVMIGRLAPRVREFMSERDPQTRDLRIEEFQLGPEIFAASRRLAEAMRAGPDDSRDGEVKEAESALREVLTRQFDVRLKLHTRELETLEKRLRELREEVDENVKGRDEKIEKRLRDIEDGIRAREERRKEAPASEGKP